MDCCCVMPAEWNTETICDATRDTAAAAAAAARRVMCLNSSRTVIMRQSAHSHLLSPTTRTNAGRSHGDAYYEVTAISL